MRHPIHLVLLLAFAILLSLPAPLHAQGAAGCAAPEYRQFDFWIGNWSVTTPQGKVAGTNRIERMVGGCVLQEHWSSSNGGDGTSLNMWTASDGKWHQVWMDAGGNMLELAGKLEGTQMVLTGTHPTPGKPGVLTTERVTWTPLAGGTVRQLWEATTDDGKSWVTQFDGLYTKRP